MVEFFSWKATGIVHCEETGAEIASKFGLEINRTNTHQVEHLRLCSTRLLRDTYLLSITPPEIPKSL